MTYALINIAVAGDSNLQVSGNSGLTQQESVKQALSHDVQSGMCTFSICITCVYVHYFVNTVFQEDNSLQAINL